jgi:homoserine dehydrogenase
LPATFRVGLLGHGTVGAAFAALLGERAGEVEAITGLRPELTGVLTRSRGDFDAIL